MYLLPDVCLLILWPNSEVAHSVVTFFIIHHLFIFLKVGICTLWNMHKNGKTYSSPYALPQLTPITLSSFIEYEVSKIIKRFLWHSYVDPSPLPLLPPNKHYQPSCSFFFLITFYVIRLLKKTQLWLRKQSCSLLTHHSGQNSLSKLLETIPLNTSQTTIV